MIRELYQASLAGVPIVLNVRGFAACGQGSRAIPDDPGLQHPRQIPRAQPNLPVRERWRARVFHRLGQLDDATSPGGMRWSPPSAIRSSGPSWRPSCAPTRRQLLGLGHAARWRVRPPTPRRGRGPAASPAGVHRALRVARGSARQCVRARLTRASFEEPGLSGRYGWRADPGSARQALPRPGFGADGTITSSGGSGSGRNR